LKEGRFLLLSVRYNAVPIRKLLVGLTFFVAIAGSACAGSPSTSLDTQDALRDEFAKTGVTLTWLKEENVSIWGGFNESIQLTMGEEIIVREFELHEFEDTEHAEFSADHVNPEGDHIVWFTGDYWVSTTLDANCQLHLFRMGKVIAIYCGDDEKILDTFVTVMGPQFAGG
jgi:hypothetical protein